MYYYNEYSLLLKRWLGMCAPHYFDARPSPADKIKIGIPLSARHTLVHASSYAVI